MTMGRTMEDVDVKVQGALQAQRVVAYVGLERPARLRKAEDPRPETQDPNPRPETRDPKPKAQNPRPKTRTRDPRPKTDLLLSITVRG